MQVNSTPSPRKLVILGTGGTIAGRAASREDAIGYIAAQVGIHELVESVPALAAASGRLVIEQLAQIDSKDMSFAVWADLAERVRFFLSRDDVDGVVITHGSDTLEETAFFLHAVLGPVKPVVLTCAMRPVTALAPDGPQNMTDAVAVLDDPAAGGVMVVCAGVIHSALDVQKAHTYRLDAFTSGDAGALGYVEENRVRWVRKWPEALVEKGSPVIKSIADLDLRRSWPWVETVMNHAGASAAGVEALVLAGVNGLVLAGTGNGTAHHVLEAALRQAQARGVRVVRATRCANGRVLPKAGDPFEDPEGLSPAKARVALMLKLISGD